MFRNVGRTHGAPYRGYGYVPLRFGGGGGGGGGVVRRTVTQRFVTFCSFKGDIVCDHK